MTTTQKRLTLQPVDAATGGGRCRDAAMVLLNAAISYGIVRLNAPVTAAFNMKQTVDAFLTAPVRNNCQKHSQKPFQRVLTRHWKPACRHGSRNTTRSFWCRLPWYRGSGYHPGNPAGYRPANEGGAMRCRGLIALLIWGRAYAADLGTGRFQHGKGAGHADGDHAAPDGTGAVR